MAIRWRKDGSLICAAMSEPEEGDTYIDDRLHHQLAAITFSIIPDANHETNGLWHWSPSIPFQVYDEFKRKAGILDENLDVIRNLGVLMEKAEKLEAVKALAPKLLEWSDDGVSWMISNASTDHEKEAQDRAEYNELKGQFKELLGIEEVMKICLICGWRGEEAEVLPDGLLRCPICGKVIEKAEGDDG